MFSRIVLAAMRTGSSRARRAFHSAGGAWVPEERLCSVGFHRDEGRSEGGV